MGTMPPATSVVSALLPHDDTAERRADDLRLHVAHRGGAEDLRGLLQLLELLREVGSGLGLCQDDRAEALAVEQHAARAGRRDAVARRVRARVIAPRSMPVAAPITCMSGAPDPVSGPAGLST